MKNTLNNLVNGKITVEECEKRIKADNVLEISGIAKLDVNRKSRTGFPEAILADTKDYDDLVEILKTYYKELNIKDNLLITRLSNESYLKLVDDISFLKDKYNLIYNKKALFQIKIIQTNERNLTIKLVLLLLVLLIYLLQRKQKLYWKKRV